MKLRVLSRSDVVSLVTMGDAIEAMARGFGQLSAAEAEMPVRGALSTGDGISLFMPARLAKAGERGAKVVSVFGGNRSLGLPSINGVILMLDDATGLPAALMDAGELTAIRTAAAAGLAARLLSRADSEVLAIFGAGVQAPGRIEAFREVRPIREVRVVSRGGESAVRLAASLNGVEARAVADPAEAVEGADIIVAVTTSRTPVFDGSRLPAGTHVSGSGSFLPDHQEVGSGGGCACASGGGRTARPRLRRRATSSSRLRGGWSRPTPIDADLGEIVNGVAPEGSAGRDLTFFKSVGTAIQDVAIGAEVLRRAGGGWSGSVGGALS